MRGEQELRVRLADLDKWIANAPRWGDAVGAMDEERREIKSALACLRAPVVSNPERAAALADLQRAYACLDRVYEYLVGPRPPPPPPSIPERDDGGTGIKGGWRNSVPPADSSGVAPLPPVRTARKWWWEVWKW